MNALNLNTSNRLPSFPNLSYQQRSQQRPTRPFYNHLPLKSIILFLQLALIMLTVSADTNSTDQTTTPVPNLTPATRGNHVEKQKALHSIRRVLENYSDDAIRRMLGPTALPQSTENNNELEPADFMTTSLPSTSTTNDHKFHDELEAKLLEDEETNENSLTTQTTAKPKTLGILRIRADIRSSSSSSSAQQNDERPLNRHYRSARHEWLQLHKRKRKGCPPLHGKDQLLCPTRNSHRYDVCISREQLCDHVVDCPGGEDEDVEQCFFYKPLDDQLKTISHAVLLLVDNIMANQQKQEL